MEEKGLTHTGAWNDATGPNLEGQISGWDHGEVVGGCSTGVPGQHLQDGQETIRRLNT